MTEGKPFSDDVDPVAAEMLLDVLLLSIIKAHPPTKSDKTTDQTRLNAAKKALFGIKTGRGRTLGSDLPELTFMASKYIAEREEEAKKLNLDNGISMGTDWIPKFSESAEGNYSGSYTLAVEALEWKHEQINKDEEVKPQLKKDEYFSERAHTLQKKFDNFQGPVLRMVYGRDGLGASVFLLHLKELKGLLDSLGLSTVDPVDPIRDAKYPI